MPAPGRDNHAAVASGANSAVALPTVQLVLSIVVPAALVSVIWATVVPALGYESGAVSAGLAGTAIVAAVMLLSVAVMMPWKTRPMDLWITIWLGGLVTRLLLTPVSAFLLYSATSLPAEPLALAVAMAYLVIVLTETAVLARHVGRHSAAHPLSGSRQTS